jgi:hypothetical protein
MQILDFRLADGEPWQNGDVLLGFFDCEVGGLRLFECLLVRAARGLLVAQTPRGDQHRGEGRVVQFASKKLRRDMCRQAFAEFLAAGSDEAKR